MTTVDAEIHLRSIPKRRLSNHFRWLLGGHKIMWTKVSSKGRIDRTYPYLARKGNDRAVAAKLWILDILLVSK